MSLVSFTVGNGPAPLSLRWRGDAQPLSNRKIRLSPILTIAEAKALVHQTLTDLPLAWVLAHGAAVAVVQRVLADHLALRLSGAVLFDPAPWSGADGLVELGLEPLACPSVVVGDCTPATATAENVLAWGSSWVPRLHRGNLDATPAIRDMIRWRETAFSAQVVPIAPPPPGPLPQGPVGR